MTAQKGKDFLMKILSGGSYALVGGFRSNGIEITENPVEVTTKESGGFQELLSGASYRSINLNGSGVFVSDAAFAEVHGHVMAGTHPDCEIIVPGHGTYTGKFFISNLSMGGEHNGQVTYTIALQNAGVVTFTAAA